MYTVQRIPIERIAKTLFTPLWTLRKRFDELGIEVRTRGGPENNKKIEMTKELYQECCRIGLTATSERLGVDLVTLLLRVKRWEAEHR